MLTFIIILVVLFICAAIYGFILDVKQKMKNKELLLKYQEAQEKDNAAFEKLREKYGEPDIEIAVKEPPLTFLKDIKFYFDKRMVLLGLNEYSFSRFKNIEESSYSQLEYFEKPSDTFTTNRSTGKTVARAAVGMAVGGVVGGVIGAVTTPTKTSREKELASEIVTKRCLHITLDDSEFNLATLLDSDYTKLQKIIQDIINSNESPTANV